MIYIAIGLVLVGASIYVWKKTEDLKKREEIEIGK